MLSIIICNAFYFKSSVLYFCVIKSGFSFVKCDMYIDLRHFGATKSAQNISAQQTLRKSNSAQVKLGTSQARHKSNSAQVKLGPSQTRHKSNSAQVKLGESQTRRKSNSAQVKLGASPTRRKSNSAQVRIGAEKKKELTLL